MEVLIILAFVFSGAAFCLNFFKGKQKAISAPAPRKAITGSVPPKGHTLKKLYNNSSDHKGGWGYVCQCGIREHFAAFPWSNGGPDHPTEEYAMKAWIRHAKLHGKFSTVEEENEWKLKFETAIQEFDEFKKKCFCKDLH